METIIRAGSTIANIKPSDITIPNFTIPDSYFQNIKIK